MKKFFMLILTVVLINNCGGVKIVVNEDNYMKNKTATMEIKHKVIEGRLETSAIRYEKEVSGKLKKPATVFFIFISQPDSAFFVETALDDTAYCIINNKKYKVPVTDITSQNNKSTGGFNGISVSRTWFILTGKLTLTKEIESEILKSNAFVYRLTTSNKPSVVEVKSEELQKVKEFLTFQIEK